ncbi:MAG: hypothetical protein GXY83_08300, partial [Rhodopirellula sp.]|nr:hypothetical protein [Rhodopirellula sp.]
MNVSITTVEELYNCIRDGHTPMALVGDGSFVAVEQITAVSREEFGTPLTEETMNRLMGRVTRMHGKTNYHTRTMGLVEFWGWLSGPREMAMPADRTGGKKPKTEDPAPETRKTRQAKWLAEAMLLVRDNPDWSDAEIARRVDKKPSTLSRSREYQAAAAMARGSKQDRRKGHVRIDEDGRRDVEAYDGDDP